VIQVEAVLDKAGLLRSCRIHGHAGAGPKGGDIVCAAVSVLAGAALRLLSGREGITVQAEAPERGVVNMEINYIAGAKDFLSGAGAFLLEGLQSVAREYPEYCVMSVTKARTEE
jgi:uncharacterized protein YsxB (DUF464 family)